LKQKIILQALPSLKKLYIFTYQIITD
jgi:hypothetical protein